MFITVSMTTLVKVGCYMLRDYKIAATPAYNSGQPTNV